MDVYMAKACLFFMNTTFPLTFQHHVLYRICEAFQLISTMDQKLLD